MSRLEVLAVVGTRPEAVKMAPVVLALRQDPLFHVRLLSTGQHRDLLAGALAPFGLRPDEDLRLMRRAQTPNAVLRAALGGVDAVLARREPGLLLVQGDTSTALAAALAAFHRRVPVAHLEAGLRTGDLAGPFPEELNRVVIDRLAALHFAPTALARRRLLAEGAPPKSVFLTGNTVVDALRRVVDAPGGFATPALRRLPGRRHWALATLHRRESHGATLRGLVSALARASARHPDTLWICPVHPNPAVRAAFAALRNRPSFVLVPPLPYADFAKLLSRCSFALTDSGGIQEETPSLGVPFLVARRKTERPEALGVWGRLIGVDPDRVEEAIARWCRRPPRPRGLNPFGDGRAAQRVVAALRHWLGRGPRPRDFASGA